MNCSDFHAGGKRSQHTQTNTTKPHKNFYFFETSDDNQLLILYVSNDILGIVEKKTQPNDIL